MSDAGRSDTLAILAICGHAIPEAQPRALYLIDLTDADVGRLTRAGVRFGPGFPKYEARVCSEECRLAHRIDWSRYERIKEEIT